MRDVQRARLATVGCVLAAGLVLAACGGSSHSASAVPTTTTTAPSGRGAALSAFVTCMGGHGITITLPARTGTPRTTVPGETTTPGATRPPRTGLGLFGAGFANRFDNPPAGVDPTKYRDALAACRSKLPTGGALQNSSAFKAYVSCLKDHGVTLGGTTTASPGTPGTTLDRNAPKVIAALKTCRPLLPAGGFGRTTTTTAPPA